MSVTKCASVVSSKFILQQTEHRTITVTAAIMQADCCTTDWRILSTAVCNCHLLPSFANNTAIEMFLHIGNGANCWQDVYHWGTVVVVVTVRVRDVGQNVLQSPRYTADPSVQMRYEPVSIPIPIPVQGQLPCLYNNNWTVSTGSFWSLSAFVFSWANSEYILTNIRSRQYQMPPYRDEHFEAINKYVLTSNSESLSSYPVRRFSRNPTHIM